jgi:hypothetical protein
LRRFEELKPVRRRFSTHSLPALEERSKVKEFVLDTSGKY